MNVINIFYHLIESNLVISSPFIIIYFLNIISHFTFSNIINCQLK